MWASERVLECLRQRVQSWIQGSRDAVNKLSSDPG